jgi:hypothetical protein
MDASVGKIRARISMEINPIQSANGLDAGLLDPDPSAQDHFKMGLRFEGLNL